MSSCIVICSDLNASGTEIFCVLCVCAGEIRNRFRAVCSAEEVSVTEIRPTIPTTILQQETPHLRALQTKVAYHKIHTIFLYRKAGAKKISLQRIAYF